MTSQTTLIPSGRAGAHPVIFLFLLFAWLALSSMIWIMLLRWIPRVAFENFGMELTQLALLVVATAIYLWKSWRFRAYELRMAAVGLAAFCFCCALRELEFDNSGVPAFVETIDKASGHITVALFGFLAVWVYPNARLLYNHVRRNLATPSAILMIIGGMFYAISWPFDHLKWTLGGVSNIFLEELSEIHGAECFVLATLLYPKGVALSRSILEKTNVL